jgi:hypothetical protein
MDQNANADDQYGLPKVVAVHSSATHTFSKNSLPSIHLIEGLGVSGDAHMGKTVQHRSRVAQDPSQPNLRQVHLIYAELFAEVKEKGFAVSPGQLGENITTFGLDLLALPCGTHLHIGKDAIVEVTGLRNPCSQIDAFQSGLLAAVLERESDGSLIRKSGVMAIVVRSGEIRVGDTIIPKLPPKPYRKLERV